jgi:N-acetylated-alpha-linked acidic dipeptidase
VSRYVDEIEAIPNQPRKNYLSGLRTEIARMHRAAADLDEAYLRALPELGSAPPAKLAALNDLLFHSERAMTIEPGLPGRPWFTHRIYAPGKYTGYEAKTLPGIREAVEEGKTDEAVEQTDQVMQVLHKLNERMMQAQKILEGF